MKLVTEKTALLTSSELVSCTLVRGNDFGDVWHHHPACELTLVLKGGTERLVGDTLEPITSGALAFIGPDVPHDYRNSPLPKRRRAPIEALVVHFMPHLLDTSWRECSSMESLSRLFTRARCGLRVEGKTRDQAASIMLKMRAVHGLRRIILLLELLELFACSRELSEISTANFTPQPGTHTVDRIGVACEHIENNFAGRINLCDLAHMTSLSESAFSRLFKKCTGCTVPQYINRLRVSHVCRLLAESDLTVSEIMRQCGFSASANFQRQFKRIHQTTPQAYRMKLRG